MTPMDAEVPGYVHTQKAPLCLFVYGTAVVLLVAAWLIRGDPHALSVTWTVIGVILCVLSTAFHHLTVADEGDFVVIRFGPLPLFRRKVRYEQIAGVEIGRTLILDGWGIHYSIRGGWVWNIWGRDCVVLHLRNGGVLRIGTDDTENLARFLQGKVGQGWA